MVYKKISSEEFKLWGEIFYDLFTDNIPNDLSQEIHDKIIDLGNLLTVEIEKGNLWAITYAIILVDRYLFHLLDEKIPELGNVSGKDYLKAIEKKLIEHICSWGYFVFSENFDEKVFKQDLAQIFTCFQNKDYLNKVLGGNGCRKPSSNSKCCGNFHRNRKNSAGNIERRI
ncbi:MAG: hypothetical protein MRERC_5c088 [Mycoplasmataceae bacterium RC_NB112A]|nr:MAG: hypothetical protein MRERC_5c088 [Mycoplasmataceae bacterium RC_NB112A]